MKKVCYGCYVAAQKRGVNDCPFCRANRLVNDADTALAMIRARVEKKDPVAINLLGDKYCHGGLGLQMDLRKAVELYTDAAELGSIDALHHLGFAYYHGEGVEQDKAKGIEFYKNAAIQGKVGSRHRLGCCEIDKGNYDRAARHLLISAKMGRKESLLAITRMFMVGFATIEQLTQARRGYQNAVEEMKSHDRDEAKSLGYTYYQDLVTE